MITISQLGKPAGFTAPFMNNAGGALASPRTTSGERSYSRVARSWKRSRSRLALAFWGEEGEDRKSVGTRGGPTSVLQGVNHK